MAITTGKWKVYDQAKKYLWDGTLDLDDTTNWKVALFLSTSNCNTLGVGTGVYGDLTNEHANGNGYTTGGIAIGSQLLSVSGGTTTFDAADVTWTAAGGSIVARFAVKYKNATVNGIIKPLLAVCLLDTSPANVTATDGNTLSVVMNVAGLLTLSGATTD
jgi:hypothetical protein